MYDRIFPPGITQDPGIIVLARAFVLGIIRGQGINRGPGIIQGSGI